MDVRVPFNDIFSSDDIREMNAEPRTFRKYASPILNLAGRFSQATRPSIVGQMTELIKEWKAEEPTNTFEDWKQWYSQRRPEGVHTAVERIKAMLADFREAIDHTDDDTIKRWVEDLVFTQSFIGLRFQEAILKLLSLRAGKAYRMATPEEESKGIDGYIEEVPISVKPETYRLKEAYAEKIVAGIIFYRKERNEAVFRVDDDLLRKIME